MLNFSGFREARPHSHPKNLHELIPGFGSLLACKVNCNGTKVSAAIKMVSYLSVECKGTKEINLFEVDYHL